MKTLKLSSGHYSTEKINLYNDLLGTKNDEQVKEPVH